MVAAGQTVQLTGTGTDLGFLGSGQNGTATGTVTVNYADDASQSFNLNIADWYANSPAVGNQLLTTSSSWNFQNNPIGPHPVSVYFASVPLRPGKQVTSVTLPTVAGPAAPPPCTSSPWPSERAARRRARHTRP